LLLGVLAVTAVAFVAWTVAADRLQGDFETVAAGFRKTENRRMVILGEPGSGKTAMAMLLTVGLLAPGAQASATAPVPVLLAASAWDPVGEKLDAWIVRSIAETYVQGEPTIARLLLDDDHLVLSIVDGLDEMPVISLLVAVHGDAQPSGTLPELLDDRSLTSRRAVEDHLLDLPTGAILAIALATWLAWDTWWCAGVRAALLIALMSLAAGTALGCGLAADSMLTAAPESSSHPSAAQAPRSN
jgi:hypothetical protein